MLENFATNFMCSPQSYYFQHTAVGNHASFSITDLQVTIKKEVAGNKMTKFQCKYVIFLVFFDIFKKRTVSFYRLF